MRRLSDRRVLTIFALVLASGLCLLVLAVRTWHTGSDGYRFLAWNLALAWIPFLLALAFYDTALREASRIRAGVLAFLWLVFLPNAPYLVTDLIHLGRIPGAPLWFDAGMIGAFAAVGLLLGLGSLFLVHAVALRRFGPLLGWALLVPVLSLCSLGVLVGRFGRLNSWDALTRPSRLADLVLTRAADPFAYRRAVVALVAYTVFLAVSYVVLYTLSSLRPERQPGTRTRRR